MADIASNVIPLRRLLPILEAILKCSKCSQSAAEQPKRLNCGHVNCTKCYDPAVADNLAQCFACRAMEFGLPNAAGGVVDELAKLYNRLRNVSLSTVVWKCNGCNKEIDIANLWMCGTCGIEFTCPKCMVGRCSHKSDNNLRTVVDDIERKQEMFHQWQKTTFDGKIDDLLVYIQKVTDRIDAVANHLNSLGERSDQFIIFGPAMEYFRSQVENVRMQVTDQKKEVGELTNLVEKYDQLLPQLSSFHLLMENMNQRTDQISRRINEVDENFSAWLQSSQKTRFE